MKVLMIGGSGFIGSHLIEATHDKWEITILDQRAPKHEHGNWMYFDILKPNGLSELLEFHDVVINLACSHLKVSHTRPIIDAGVNILGTLRTLEILKELDTNIRPKYLHFSTGSIYRLDKFVNHYSVSKAAGDHYVQLYTKQYDLDATIIRPFQVFGVGGHGITNTFIKQAMTNIPYSIHSDGNQLVTPTHVNDVVEVTKRVIDLGVWQKIFTVAGRNPVSVNTLADFVDTAVSNCCYPDDFSRKNKRNYIKQPSHYKELQFVPPPYFYQALEEELKWEQQLGLLTRIKQTVEACEHDKP